MAWFKRNLGPFILSKILVQVDSGLGNLEVKCSETFFAGCQMPATRRELVVSLENVGRGDATPAEAVSAIREAIQSGEELGERVYAALRDVTWRTLTSRAFNDELAGWFDVMRHGAALARRASGASLAEKLRVLSDLIAQSARFAELQPVDEVLNRKHVIAILRRLASSVAPTARADLARSTGLANANLSRVLAVLASSGLVERKSSGKEALFSLTSAGRSVLERKGALPAEAAVAESVSSVPVLAGAAAPAVGQQTKSGPKIGIVYTTPFPLMNEVIARFKEVVTKAIPNAAFFERHADGRKENYRIAVSEAIDANPDLLVTITTPITKLAKEQTRGRIPIVFIGVTDPVGAGVVGDRVTGSSDPCFFPELLQMARQVLPKAETIGLPYDPSDEPAIFSRRELIKLAKDYNFRVIDRQVKSVDELPEKVRDLASRVDVIVIAADNLMMANARAVVSSALKAGKLVLACDSGSVEAGAVAAFSVNYRQEAELAGQLAVEVLNGRPPEKSSLMVPDLGEMVMDLTAARKAKVPKEGIDAATQVFLSKEAA